MLTKHVNGLKKLNVFMLRLLVLGNKNSKMLDKKKCCTVKSTIQGGKVLHRRRICKWSGYRIVQSKHKRCNWVTGGNKNESFRKYKCCVFKNTCHDKKGCTTVKKNCHFVKVIKTKIVKRCKWKKIGRYGKVNRCCSYRRTCQRGKKCREKLIGCLNACAVITYRPMRRCRVVKVGKSGKQKKCCTWVRRCQRGKCQKKRYKCGGVGPIIYTLRKRECEWNKISRKCRRRKCTTRVETCVNGHCKVHSRSSNYRGKSVCAHPYKKCSWVTVGKTGRRRKCCNKVKKCVGRKCSHKNKFCWWTSQLITRNYEVKCKVQKYGKWKRKQCCNIVRHCCGQKCHYKKTKCTWKGPVIIKRTIKRCSKSKYRGGTRRRCCYSRQHCHNRKCETSKPSCKWVGKATWVSIETSYKWKYRNTEVKQRLYCRWKKTCVGTKKNCRHSRKTCSWKGYKITSKKYHGCSWKPFTKYGRRIKCCSHIKTCHKQHCTKHSKKCKWKGKIFSLRPFNKCRWVKVGGFKQRRRCCSWERHCINRKCFNNNKGCRWTSAVVHKGCVWRDIKVCVAGKKKLPKLTNLCRSSGDPHYSTFRAQRYNMYTPGDWILTKSDSFEVHTRTKTWRRASVNTEFVVKVNKENDRVLCLTENKIYVNGKIVRVAKGNKYTLPLGGFIQKLSTYEIKVQGEDGSFVKARFQHQGTRKRWPRPQFISMWVHSENPSETTGMCSSKSDVKRARGLFTVAYTPELPYNGPTTCAADKMVAARAKCIEGKVAKRHLDICAEDICVSGFSTHLAVKETKDMENDKPKE